jgi:hypothetical protein
MMCVCAVGSLLRDPMSMDDKYGKRGDDGQENHPQPHCNHSSRPSYEFYGQGITEANRGWIEVIIASIRNAHGKYLVTVVVVWALYKIACEFLEKGSNNLSYKSITGTLLVAGMVLAIGLFSLRRNKDTDVGQKENREKDKDESAESGAGGISPGQNRRTSTRNRGSNANGGGK